MSGVRPRHRVRRAAGLASSAAIAGILAAALFAAFGEHWWLFDLFSHFRWQYAALASVVAVLTLFLRFRWIAIAAVLAGAVHVPAVLERPEQIAPMSADGTADLAITTANVWWRSHDLDALLGRIKVADPDIVVLQEVHGHWQRAVETLLARYPHVAPANWRESGVVILSREPILASRGGGFVVTADIDFKGRRLRVAGVHLPTPLSAAQWHAQDEAFAALAAEARAGGMAFIAAGDFNLTPYSRRFGRFLAAAALHRTPAASLWPATWPAASGLKYGGPFWRGFEIDHVLVSRDFASAGSQRGPDIGSDHFPVHVRLKFLR